MNEQKATTRKIKPQTSNTPHMAASQFYLYSILKELLSKKKLVIKAVKQWKALPLAPPKKHKVSIWVTHVLNLSQFLLEVWLEKDSYQLLEQTTANRSQPGPAAPVRLQQERRQTGEWVENWRHLQVHYWHWISEEQDRAYWEQWHSLKQWVVSWIQSAMTKKAI